MLKVIAHCLLQIVGGGRRMEEGGEGGRGSQRFRHEGSPYRERAAYRTGM